MSDVTEYQSCVTVDINGKADASRSVEDHCAL